MRTPSSKSGDNQEPTWQEPASLPSERESDEEQDEQEGTEKDTGEGTRQQRPDTGGQAAYPSR